MRPRTRTPDAVVVCAQAVYSLLERRDELRALEEYRQWEEMVEDLAEKRVLVGRFENLATEMLTASNPDPAVREERQRRKAEAEDDDGNEVVLSAPVLVVLDGGADGDADGGANAPIFHTVYEDGTLPLLMRSVSVTADTLFIANVSVVIRDGYQQGEEELVVNWDASSSQAVSLVRSSVNATWDMERGRFDVVARESAMGVLEVETVLQLMQFLPTTDTPVQGERTIVVLITDDDGRVSDPVEVKVTLLPSDDPTYLRIGMAETTLLHDVTGESLVAPTVSILDPDTQNFVRAEARISGNPQVGDVLQVVSLADGESGDGIESLVATWDAGDFTLSVLSDTPLPASVWEAMLARVAFSTVSASALEERAVTFAVWDEHGTKSIADKASRAIRLFRECGPGCGADEYDFPGCHVGSPRNCVACTSCDDIGAESEVSPCGLLVDGAHQDTVCRAAAPIVVWNEMADDPVSVLVATSTLGASLVVTLDDEPAQCDSDSIVSAQEAEVSLQVGTGRQLNAVACLSGHLEASVSQEIVLRAPPLVTPVVFTFSLFGFERQAVSQDTLAGIVRAIADVTGIHMDNILITALLAQSLTRRRLLMHRRVQEGPSVVVEVQIVAEDELERSDVEASLELSVVAAALVDEAVVSSTEAVGLVCDAGEWNNAGLCVPWSAECGENQHELEAPTSSSDRVCASCALHNCAGGCEDVTGECDQCAVGHYDNGSADSTACTACDTACAGECTGPGPSSCVSCGEGYFTCGGDSCQQDVCGDGLPCDTDSQCASGACVAGACSACSDGAVSGDETCIDGGGDTCEDRCGAGEGCAENADCEFALFCQGETCAACDPACVGCTGGSSDDCLACSGDYFDNEGTCMPRTAPSIDVGEYTGTAYAREGLDSGAMVLFDAATVVLGDGEGAVVRLSVDFSGASGGDELVYEQLEEGNVIVRDADASTTSHLELVVGDGLEASVADWTSALRRVSIALDDAGFDSAQRSVQVVAVDADGRTTSPAAERLLQVYAAPAGCDDADGWQTVPGGCAQFTAPGERGYAGDDVEDALSFCPEGTSMPSVHNEEFLVALHSAGQAAGMDTEDEVWLGATPNPAWIWPDGSAATEVEGFWEEDHPTVMSGAHDQREMCAAVDGSTGLVFSVRCEVNGEGLDGLCRHVDSGTGDVSYTLDTSVGTFSDLDAACGADSMPTVSSSTELFLAAEACTSGRECLLARARPIQWMDGSDWSYDNFEAGDERWKKACLRLDGHSLLEEIDCDDSDSWVVCFAASSDVTVTADEDAQVATGSTSILVTGSGFVDEDVRVWLSSPSGGSIQSEPNFVEVMSSTELLLEVSALSAELAGHSIAVVVAIGGVHSGDAAVIATVAAAQRRLTEANDVEDDEERATLGALPVWDFRGSMFFCFSECACDAELASASLSPPLLAAHRTHTLPTALITTIGYGTSAPTTLGSKLFLMLYSLIGIAAAGFLLDAMGRFVLLGVTAAYQRLTGRRLGARDELKLLLVLGGVMLLLMGLIVSALEWGERGSPAWDAWEGIYFAWVTLSTVGLGDYAPTTNMSRAVVGIFCCIGLGVLSSLFSSLAAVAAEHAVMVEQLRLTGSGVVRMRTNFLRFAFCGMYQSNQLVPSDAKAAEGGASLPNKPELSASAKHHAAAQQLWAVAAQETTAFVRSRRGDSLRTIVPRTAISFVAFMVILCAGAAVFSLYEREPEEAREAEFGTWSEMVEELQAHNAVLDTYDKQLEDMLSSANPNSASRAAAVRGRLAAEGGLDNTTLLELLANDARAPLPQWDFFGACFFAFTIVTTVGYGSYSTVTRGGQLFTVVYGTVGIVVGAAVLDSVSRLMLGVVTNVHHRMTGRKTASQREELALGFLLSCVILAIGATIFVALQAGSGVEWEWPESAYFSFVTATSTYALPVV